MITDLQKYFNPKIANLRWIDSYCLQTSVIGPAAEPADFWSLRPSLSSQVPTVRGQQGLHQPCA